MIETQRERVQKAREKREFVSSLQLRKDYEDTFSTPAGRRVLAHHIERGHILDTTCSGNAWSYFYEGEKNFVLAEMAMVPGLFAEVLMQVLKEKQQAVDAERADLLKDEPTK
jgi:hypothetical protein